MLWLFENVTFSSSMYRCTSAQPVGANGMKFDTISTIQYHPWIVRSMHVWWWWPYSYSIIFHCSVMMINLSLCNKKINKGNNKIILLTVTLLEGPPLVIGCKTLGPVSITYEDIYCFLLPIKDHLSHVAKIMVISYIRKDYLCMPWYILVPVVVYQLSWLYKLLFIHLCMYLYREICILP